MQDNTICAIATANGGALGIIRISGPKAIEITDCIFHGRQTLSQAKGYTLHYGKIQDPENGEIIDDVMLSLFRAPHSYTGEDSIEISAHASAYILQRICQLLIKGGCSMAMPGEYTQRAFLNGKLDLTQAEAVADLIASNSAASHHLAMQQMRGGVSGKLTELRKRLLHLTSLLELELDFSDHEDLEFADRTALLSLANDISREIKRLSNSFEQGNAIKNGIPVAIIGAPNVGKSTLLNALLQEERAIVSDIQGTTRDVIEETLNIDGILFRFIDTAGIRHTTDTIEQLGIERSRKAAEKAKVIILMTEPGVPYPAIMPSDHQHVIHVINKSDLADITASTDELHISAKQGTGLEALKQKLRSTIQPSTTDEVLITNLRHKTALDQSLADITAVIEAMSIGIPSDLIAEDLRQCLSHLAEITGGEITTNEVLGNIFSHFCIGK